MLFVWESLIAAKTHYVSVEWVIALWKLRLVNHMKLLKGRKDLIPQKSKLNLTAHRSPIQRSMLCCLHHTGGAKGRATGRNGREGADSSWCVVFGGSQSRKAASLLPKYWCCHHGKCKSLWWRKADMMLLEWGWHFSKVGCLLFLASDWFMLLGD